MTRLLEPSAFVWCIAGPHIGETLVDIVDRRTSDIERFGWCLWAYGGMGNTHPETEVRRLATEHADGGVLPLLMPDTGKKYPANGVPCTRYRTHRDGIAEELPDGMSSVTGGRSSWAFWITSLEWSDDAAVDTARYMAPYARRGQQPLPEYLKGSRGRACAALDGRSRPAPERRIDVLATLNAPYAVFLDR